MRRLSRWHLSIRVSWVRLLLLLSLVLVLALMGWLVYVQPAGPIMLTNA
jgi:hypothetical protein